MRAQAVEKNFQLYSNVGCDMLLPFAHPVSYRVVESCCAKFETVVSVCM